MSTVTSAAETARRELGDEFGGQLIGPDDTAYEEARKVYNGMIDRRPALIARCAGPDDVARTIRFAREHDLLLAVRGGGHNGGGLGIVDDGVVCDLSLLRSVEVDPKARTVKVGGGCTWSDVDAATSEFDLAVPCGIISTTGVGGLTLGGGLGHLTRMYGLSIDNLLGADMVLADGTQVHAGADENPDLYWAIRGGGGNFGVVTTFHFRANPVGTVQAGPTFWPIEQSTEVLSAYREFLPSAPRELTGFFAYHFVPPAPPFPEELHGRLICGVVWNYIGDEDAAAKAMKPLLDVGTPLMHGVHAMPIATLNGAFDGLYPPGDQWYWRADFVEGHLGRGGGPAHGVRREAADGQVDDAHVPDRRRGSRRRAGGHARGRIATRAGAASWSASTPTPRRRTSSGSGRSTTGKRCTPTRPAAPT